MNGRRGVISRCWNGMEAEVEVVGFGRGYFRGLEGIISL